MHSEKKYSAVQFPQVNCNNCVGCSAGASLIMAAVVGLKMNKCSRFSLGAPSLLEESDIHIFNTCKLYKGELQIKYYGSVKQILFKEYLRWFLEGKWNSTKP